MGRQGRRRRKRAEYAAREKKQRARPPRRGLFQPAFRPPSSSALCRLQVAARGDVVCGVASSAAE